MATYPLYIGVSAAAVAAMYLLSRRNRASASSMAETDSTWGSETVGYDERMSSRPMRLWLGSRFTPSDSSSSVQRPRTVGKGDAAKKGEEEAETRTKAAGEGHPEDALGTGASDFVEAKRGTQRGV
jgi:hypothetical protein